MITLAEKKMHIVKRLDSIQDEWIIKAIEKLLDIPDREGIPDWHFPLVMESVGEYKANPQSAVSWEELQKEWENEV